MREVLFFNGINERVPHIHGNRFNTVALINPDTKAVAMGAQEMDLLGIPMAMGSRPKVVVMVVIRTGRMRAAQDSMMA